MDEKLLGEMNEQWTLVREMAEKENRSATDVIRLLQYVIENEDFIAQLDTPRKATKKIVEATKVVNDLLRMVSTVDVPATTESFLASERFVRDVSANARVKIYGAGGNFSSWFGKMLVAVHSGSNLASHVLTRDAYDREILSALGGEAKCETTLAEIWQLMSRQGHGESGALLADGKANIFYVRDQSSVLRAVRVFWDDDGWSVVARELDYCRWYRGRRVFVRNS